MENIMKWIRVAVVALAVTALLQIWIVVKLNSLSNEHGIIMDNQLEIGERLP